MKLKNKKSVKTENKNEITEVLANCIDDVFVIFSADDYSVEYVSPNIERVLGIPVADVQKNLESLGKGKYIGDKEITYASLKEIKVGESVSFIVGREHLKKKEQRFFNETLYLIEQNEGEKKFILVISDRTKELLAKQSLEEALKIASIANQSKSTFLANMSHDIRTPMNSIVGLCTLLRRDIDDKEKLNEHIRQITLTSRHMLTLINDILDMTKIDTGDTTLNMSEINVVELIKEINATIAPQARAKKQTFKTTCAIKTEKFMGDKVRVKRVMLNILSNAVRYTQEGGQINFTVQQLSRPSRKYVYMQFIVKDNGVGMSEQFVKKIFEPYSREMTGAAENHGTGLGMAVAKNLIDLMGGTISVESREGEGSTFAVIFKFPISKINDGNFWVDQGVARVLVIGDNNLDNNSITWAMRKTEVAISFAKSVKAACASIDKALAGGKGYNLVIYCWDGEEEKCLNEIRELRQGIPKFVPLIAFGDCEWEEIESSARTAGVDSFLLKPFTVSTFQECVQELKMNVREGLVPKSDKSVLDGMRFLAAEDNELNAMVLGEILSMVGANCVIKPNGKEALDEFLASGADQYDCILMDVQMPVMDGYAATRAIRESEHVNAKTVPIVAMTANAFAEDVKASLEAGMNAYLLKPFDVGRLEEVVAGLKQSE